MANWHYFNENREKIGPITGRELKQLVQQGTVTPETFVEDPNGRTGLAKDVNGLVFPETPSEQAPPEPEELFVATPPPVVPSPFVPSPFVQTAQVPHTAPTPPPSANLFCTNCGNSIDAQAVACMSCGARPTGHKKFCRQCGIGLNPEQVICIKCGAELDGTSGGGTTANFMSVFQTTSGAPGTPAGALSKTLNIYFMVCWICTAVGITLQLLGTITTHMGLYIAASGRNADGILTLGWAMTIIPLPIVIVGTVFGYMLLYQLWKQIPADIARTTPGKAVGFCLIPFFNFYWFFVAYKGLGEDTNKTLQRCGIPYRVNDLGLSFCILAILAYVPFALIPPVGPYIATLIAAAMLIVYVFFVKSIINGVLAFMEQGGCKV